MSVGIITILSFYTVSLIQQINILKLFRIKFLLTVFVNIGNICLSNKENKNIPDANFIHIVISENTQTELER